MFDFGFISLVRALLQTAPEYTHLRILHFVTCLWTSENHNVIKYGR